MTKERLVTPSYCYILAANFMLFFGFYLLMPVLPLYLSEMFGAEKNVIGLVLACYTVAALIIRPFSGYVLDMFARKPLYLVAFFIFFAVSGGYLLAGTLTLFTMLRVAHGFSFGMVTVAGNTIVIDVMPSSRRGEGLGYYGLANNIAMATGPMTGLFLHDYYSFDTIFICAFIAGVLGFIMAVFVKTPSKPPVKREPLSLDRFLLFNGIPAGISLLLLAIPYGMTTAFIAMYAKEIGINSGIGLFFTLMAVGLAFSRIFSGKQVDRGQITQVISWGMYLACICFFILGICPYIASWQPLLLKYVFFGSALVLGMGFGMMFPAFNTMFVNLAPNNKRGTATSTYLVSWDLGIGVGLVLGGYIANLFSFDHAYIIGACMTVVSTIFFKVKVTPHFLKNRCR